MEVDYLFDESNDLLFKDLLEDHFKSKKDGVNKCLEKVNHSQDKNITSPLNRVKIEDNKDKLTEDNINNFQNEYSHISSNNIYNSNYRSNMSLRLRSNTFKFDFFNSKIYKDFQISKKIEEIINKIENKYFKVLDKEKIAKISACFISNLQILKEEIKNEDIDENTIKKVDLDTMRSFVLSNKFKLDLIVKYFIIIEVRSIYQAIIKENKYNNEQISLKSNHAQINVKPVYFNLKTYLKIIGLKSSDFLKIDSIYKITLNFNNLYKKENDFKYKREDFANNLVKKENINDEKSSVIIKNEYINSSDKNHDISIKINKNDINFCFNIIKPYLINNLKVVNSNLHLIRLKPINNKDFLHKYISSDKNLNINDLIENIDNFLLENSDFVDKIKQISNELIKDSINLISVSICITLYLVKKILNLVPNLKSFCNCFGISCSTISKYLKKYKFL